MRHRSPSETVGVPSSEIELDRAALDAQKEIWLAARPAAYSFEVETECECFRAGTYSVTVEGEEILSIKSHASTASSAIRANRRRSRAR